MGYTPRSPSSVHRRNPGVIDCAFWPAPPAIAIVQSTGSSQCRKLISEAKRSGAEKEIAKPDMTQEGKQTEGSSVPRCESPRTKYSASHALTASTVTEV